MYFYGENPPPNVNILQEKPPFQYLSWSEGKYFLMDGLQRHSPLTIDFDSAFYRARGGVEYLPKNFRGISTIADATTGWGRDAWLLAYRGFDVFLHERNLYLAFLLQEALKNTQNPVAKRLHFIGGDFCQTEAYYEAIYLDPMFPERKKSAKVGKEMQALQLLLHANDTSADEAQLLDLALQKATKKVIVKRPKSAPFLANKAPCYSLESPNTRYDCYQI